MTLVLGIVCLVIYHLTLNKHSLPRPAIKMLEPGTLYTLKLTLDDPRSFGMSVVQQDYLVPLNAGQLYRFETRVGWMSVKATLTDNQKRLEELHCGYSARCSFTVKPEQNTLALLRVYTDDLDSEFTLDIRKEDNLFVGSKQSERTEVLKPTPIPVIDTNTTYTGEFLKTDAPLYTDGIGYVQHYRIQLAEGQNVTINLEQNGIDAGVEILDRELKTLESDFMHPDEKESNLCIETKAAYDGMYLIRILSRDPKTLENGKFKLGITQSDEKTCQIDVL